jgi:glucose-6-phosphate isomerase
MSVTQSIELAWADRVGPHGVSAENLTTALERAGTALEWIRARHADGALPLLRLPALRDDLPQVEESARKLTANATDIVFLGTGGSSLGAQTLVQLAGHAVPGWGLLRGAPRLHFLDNLDPISFDALLARLTLSSTRFVAISKSGGTGETLMQTMAVLEAMKDAKLEARIAESMLGITEPAVAGKKNGLRELLAAHQVPMLEHDPGVGGRFSVLTNVGLLPAACAGLDIAEIRAGAARALQPILEGKPAAQVPAALGAALAVSLAGSKPISVVMAYTDRLERFARWYVQLWAESLGKDGKGTTPLGALGPVDQHSQLQLFIAGPRDKLFTIITLDVAGRGPHVARNLAKLAGDPGLGGKAIGDLVAAQGRATAETLAKNGCPVRTIQIDRLDEQSLGELLMHFMLETIIAAQLLGVDAFDQPAVEEGKVIARQYLGEMGRQAAQ